MSRRAVQKRRRRGWRIPQTGVVAALVTFMMLGGSGLAYGYWSAQASVTSTAKATSLAVTVTNLGSIQNTFQNHIRTKTGSFTVSNATNTASTATVSIAISLGIIPGGSALLAGNIDVTVWGPATAASCTETATPSGTVTTGTWASFTGYSVSLAATQSSTWCVRSTNSERSDLSTASGSFSIQPQVTTNMTVGAWTTQASASTTQSTSYIYPATTPILSRWYFIKSKVNGNCLDVKGAGGVGVELIEWTCKTYAENNDNQQWKLGDARTNGYYDITPKHDEAIRWDANGSVTAGTGITVQANDGTDSQLWQVQQTDANLYQIVNYKSGMCIQPTGTLSTGETRYGQAVCDGSLAQQFTLELATFDMGVSCDEIGSGSSKRIVYDWDTAAAGAFTFQADKDTGGATNWQTIGSTTLETSTSLTISGDLPATGGSLLDWDQHTYDVRVLDAGGNVVDTDQVRVRGNDAYLRCD